MKNGVHAFKALVFLLSVSLIPLQAIANNHEPPGLKPTDILVRALNSEMATSFSNIETLQFTLTGYNWNPRQAYNLTGNAAPGEEETRLYHYFYDFEAERYREYQREVYFGGHDLRFEELFRDGTSYFIPTQMRRFSESKAPFSSTLEPLSHFPGYVLQRAEEAIPTLTFEGEAEFNGDQVYILSFDWQEGSRRQIYISKEDFHLIKMTWAAPDLITTEREIEMRYVGRSEIGGVKVANKIDYFVNGERWSERTLARFDPAADFPKAVFEIDPDLAPFTEEETSSMKITEVKGPVYQMIGLASGLYTVPFVEFDSFVVVYDAILHPGLAQAIISKINDHTGGKPIKYVILSHNHTDHIRGLKSFVEAGAAVITTPETEPRVGQLLGEMEAGVLLVQKGTPFVIEEGSTQLEIHNLGPTPHVDDLLAVVVTSHNTLIQADGYFEFSRFNAIFDFFLDWAGKQNLENPTVIGVHHMPINLESLKLKSQTSREGFTPEYLHEMDLSGE